MTDDEIRHELWSIWFNAGRIVYLADKLLHNDAWKTAGEDRDKCVSGIETELDDARRILLALRLPGNVEDE